MFAQKKIKVFELLREKKFGRFFYQKVTKYIVKLSENKSNNGKIYQYWFKG